MRRRFSTAGLLVAAALLAGCATTGQGNRADPWEGWNRKVYAFNEGLDTAVLRPVATTYRDVVPEPVRTGVTNVFAHIGDVWSAVNNMLQGKPGNGLRDVMRFGTNTLFGLFGIFDVAAEAGLERQGEDFGQTLGVWGVGAGPYIVWPVLGPSSLRESVALPLELQVSPTLYTDDRGTQVGISVLQVVNTRANLLGATRMLDDIALDKYSFVRDGYLQRRRSLVYDGDPPEVRDEEDYAAEPASGSASAPAK
jgi:phospholipid-binding lipoprotein MlaA